jgi:hypothetical protein
MAEEAEQRNEPMIAALKRLRGAAAPDRVEPKREGAAVPPEGQAQKEGE